MALNPRAPSAQSDSWFQAFVTEFIVIPETSVPTTAEGLTKKQQMNSIGTVQCREVTP